LVLAPDRKVVSGALQEAFLDRHRDAIDGIAGLVSSGYGLCCTGSWPVATEACIGLTFRVCSTPIEDVAQILSDLLRDDNATDSSALAVSIQLEGVTEPRCEDDSRGPLSYNGSVRIPVRPAAERTPECRSDCDCVKGGCGNDCVHWTMGGMFGICDLEPDLSDTYCGCVDYQCGWFRERVMP
jgi:hypothetical protein